MVVVADVTHHVMDAAFQRLPELHMQTSQRRCQRDIKQILIRESHSNARAAIQVSVLPIIYGTRAVLGSPLHRPGKLKVGSNVIL